MPAKGIRAARVKPDATDAECERRRAVIRAMS